MRKVAPAFASARGIAGKAFSKQMGVANGGTCPTWIGASEVPGTRSTGIWSIAWMKPSRSRNGTYSPNGTRCVLS